MMWLTLFEPIVKLGEHESSIAITSPFYIYVV